MIAVTAPPDIFDRPLYRLRRQRSASHFADHDFLHRRAMADVVDRLETVTRDFDCAVFYGAGLLTEMLTLQCGVKEFMGGDLAGARLSGESMRVVFDEEASPLRDQSLDLIVSLLTLHNANDLVGALSQMRAALKPDGLMIAVLFGEETLKSFRNALYYAESGFTGGVSPRIAPFASVRDLGGALQRAGFALPVADIDTVSVTYKKPFRLIEDLRGMGETNCLKARARPLSRSIMPAALAKFVEDGGETRFDLVFLTGWAPHARQQQPLKPGSAKTSLKDAIEEY